MDAITQLFTDFHFRTDLFFVGNLCHIGQFDNADRNKGYLHFIRKGRGLLSQPNKPPIQIDHPCVIFSSAQFVHHIHPLEEQGLDIFCIQFDFGKGIGNPLTQGLQEIILLFLNSEPNLAMIAEQIFAETAQQSCGYHVAIQHLCAYFVIQVIRCCLQQKALKAGLLKGLTDKHLATLLLNIHQHPEYNWQLDQMAEQVMMSRSRFSDYFKRIMGISAIEYITQCRIYAAQKLLKKGVAVGRIAEQVGYSHNAALTRAFMREVGVTPTEWLNQQKQMNGDNMKEN